MADRATQPRKLVLCFDGTSNKFDEYNTNVVKLFALLKKDDSAAQQLCYYQAGVGTWFHPGVVSPIFEWGAKVLDLAFAWYLDAHVLDGYKFLMQNYRPGDKICMFGFSRGAYTARGLAAFLGKAGLLPRDNDSQMPFAFKLYKRTDPAGLELCAGFKRTYCQHVNVEFVGVWDTVASVGVAMGGTLPFNNDRGIKIFRQALSLDEHRATFQPNFHHCPKASERAWNQYPETDLEVTGDLPSTSSPAPMSSTPDRVEAFPGRKSSLEGKSLMERKATGKAYAPVIEEPVILADIREVWFSGCHSDVGGGAVPNNTLESLANNSLRWMVNEVIKSECGILFDPVALAQAGIVGVSPESTGRDLGLDDIDSLQSINDELKINKLWWILEIIPLIIPWQDVQRIWHRSFSFRLGKERNILEPRPNFHITVRKRMESGLNYKPKATWVEGTEVYVQ